MRRMLVIFTAVTVSIAILSVPHSFHNLDNHKLDKAKLCSK